MLLVVVGVVTDVSRKSSAALKREGRKANSRSGAGDDGDLVLETEAGSGHCDQIVLNNGVRGSVRNGRTMC